MRSAEGPLLFTSGCRHQALPPLLFFFFFFLALQLAASCAVKVSSCRYGGGLDYSVCQCIKSFEASGIGVFAGQFVIEDE